MKKLKKIKLQEILGIFIFIILVIPAFIRKHILKKELWLISEYKIARDNGYVFFKYMRENHPEIDCYYAVDYNHNDFKKVEKLGHTVKWESLKHYYYYMSATWNLSSHKNGTPNHMLFMLLRLKLNLYNNFVFLQHGITCNNLEMFHKKNAKFKIFVAGAKPEADYLTNQFNYNNNEVRYTGFARFDNLHGKKCNEDIILFMPTWRRWLTEKNDLLNSEYFKHIESLLSNKKLDELLEKYNKKIIFCAHGGLKDVCNNFKTSNKNIEVLNINETDVQKLLIKGAVLITDYSSIHFDFAYMKKPVIYYQYDVEDFLKKHIGKDFEQTYYKYERDCFGPIAYDEKELLKELEKIIKSSNKVEKEYIDKIEKFFPLNDTKNCERIYNELVGEKYE